MTQNKPLDYQRPHFRLKPWQQVYVSPKEDKEEDEETQTIKQCIKTRGIIGGSKIA